MECWFPQRDRVLAHVDPRVLWWVWEQLVAEAKALTQERTPLPVLFAHGAAARASFRPEAPPGRFRLSLVCPAAPGVASRCRWCWPLPGVRLRGHPVPD